MASRVPPCAQRVKWFHQARFGMFIHWGLYSLLGRGEWVMLRERIPANEYAELASQFNPVNFDGAAWANLAAESGTKYMVLTSRHHDGFCLFDSQVSDFTTVKTVAKRDFVAEYVIACRKAKLKVGLYYSLLDWRFPGYFDPKTFPSCANAMVLQAHEQVRELLTNYGKIDLLWFDGGWAAHGEEGAKDMSDFWESKRLIAMARKLQPHILINNRARVDADLDTPEQHVTASRSGRAWESCMTIGDSCGWGYVRNNPNMKTMPELLQNLVTAAAGEGNYLLNIGPRPDGTVRKEETARLRAMGRWLETNGDGIYGSQRCELAGGMIGTWTRRGKVGYLHVFRWPGREAVVPLVKTRATSAILLSTGKRAKVHATENGRLVISNLPPVPPHPHINVIQVRFADVPKSMAEPNKAAWIEGKAK